MLQIRVANFDGSNPIILENAKNRSVTEVVNSSDEGGSFDIAKNDPKAYVIDPDNNGDIKRWEAWDTDTNTRINYGPITSITEAGTDWRVEGAGRSAFLADLYKSKSTFYSPIHQIIDDLRYENLAIEPRTSTIVHDTKISSEQDTVFGASVIIDEKYSGLSVRSKDFAIDEEAGAINLEKPPAFNTYRTNIPFWSGMSTADTLVVDLAGRYEISKIKLTLPTWGGIFRQSNRAYDYEVAYATDNEATLTNVQNRDIGPWHTIYNAGTNNKKVNGNITYYLGQAASGSSYDFPVQYVAQDLPGAATARYIRVKINDTHAWYGTRFDTDPDTSSWEYQCDPNYVAGSNAGFGSKEGIMHGKEISDREIGPANDCHASVIEVGAFTEVVGRDAIKPLALQRIDNNNLQISYSHNADASETETTSAGLRKFEPGSFFRRFDATWSGANTSYTKFFPADCANCYPDGFNFAILDQNNSMVLASDSAAGSGLRTIGAFTKHLLMKGTTAATVTWCDAWPALTDPLSWGGSYSYTEILNDYASVHFRGQSFRWYATVPTGKTGATAKIEIRNKDAAGAWTGYTTLNAGLVLPNDISSEIVYEISYESGTLLAETVYEIKITNLDGNYLSIDSFEGYWSASYTQYNEDSLRLGYNRPEQFTQIYDSRFTGGSMRKWNAYSAVSFGFEGDRIIVTSAKGHNHGKLKLHLFRFTVPQDYNPPDLERVFIPGGNVDDGYLPVDLHVSKRASEIPQAVIFDSNDSFPTGLPWGRYAMYIAHTDLEPYTTTSGDLDSDSFVSRCSNCKAATGSTQTVNKYVYIDAVGAHERIGLSVIFKNETHLDILKNMAEALQVEWMITEAGVRLEPRVGTDTNEVLREGQNTLVNYEVVNDVSKVASILISSGADIDGLPLFTVTEDKATRDRIGRTIMRQQDFRDIADYFTLVGVSRTELKKRARPEKRITVSHIGDLTLQRGDSLTLFTKKMGPIRVRIMRKKINESSGRIYELECIKWPLTV